ncbi:glycosyltransferase family 39 protein [Leptolyngbya sp. PCC 6406]|uniref:glycosyltransferase family 39 protein n=1 Tax=Leptolyngbya sp. PCC 6406 TaxID=1173264 RepID=UPI0002ACF28B|nr:glycosyltransferase family 39 protein [Leptolyngbya sp. PCC 6406]
MMKTLLKLTLVSLLWLLTITSGDMGSLDTELRLQMAHAWWTGTEEVKVSPDITPIVRGDIRFGVEGADGSRYIAYETGQSFLMLPADWIGTQIHRSWPVLSEQTTRNIAVSILTFIPVNIALILAVYWLLKLFSFENNIAVASSLLLLLGTTVLHYAQVHQHNNQLLLLAVLGYATAIKYLQTQQAKWSFLSGLALGMAICIRVTSVIHAFAVMLFLVGAILWQEKRFRKLINSLIPWIVGILPLLIFSRYVDFLRFGSFFASGKSVEKLQLATDPMWEGLPQLPDNYPLINNPHVGILGPLLSPAKSIFLYDPLLIPCLILVVIAWHKLSPLLRLYLFTAILNLSLHLAAYSRFVFWHGDSAWGARYHVTSVHLLLIPLLGLFLGNLLIVNKVRRWAMLGIAGVAISIQLFSVSMPMNLEIFQKNVGVPGTRFDLRLLQRPINLACLVNSSLSRSCVEQNPNSQEFVEGWNHIYFLPFNLAQNSDEAKQAPRLIGFLYFFWTAMLIGSVASTAWLTSSLLNPENKLDMPKNLSL